MDSTQEPSAPSRPRLPSRKTTAVPNAHITTTFLIENLHCPSCASTIESALYALKPSPMSISHSIIQHSVTVQHDVALSLQTMADSLAEASYEVYDVFQDPETKDLESIKGLIASLNESGHIGGEHPPANASKGTWWPFALGIVSARHSKEDEEKKKRKRHVENCALCREQEEEDLQEKKPLKRQDTNFSKTHHPVDKTQRPGEAKTVEEPSKNSSESTNITIDSTESSKYYRAALAIEGMTCSSCVTNVSRALEAAPWITSVDVNLLTNSAVVKFKGEENERKDEIVEMVEDAGYDATITEINEIVDKHVQSSKTDLWKATFAVGGMTCSSCVSSVTSALQEHKWVKKVDVNLVGNSAVVEFEGKDHLSEIEEAIEDVGFTATLDDVVDCGEDTVEETSRRVMLRINGIYCKHCSPRIEAALEKNFAQQVQIEHSASQDSPIITVSYEANPPELTIRTIITAIESADENFKVDIYHPPSIEERSRKMHAREQKRIMYRVIFSFIVAIPTFIIGVVYMDLVPSTNSGQQYLMQPLQGVSRAVWALLVLATPVYFFAADIFHRRTLKEIYSLWRPGSSTPIYKRFLRFGSMNMLVSLGTSVAYFSSIVELILAATASSKAQQSNSSYYFDSVVFLTMFLLLGRFIEAYSKAKTGDAVALLGQLRPDEALLLSDASGEGDTDKFEKVSVDLLEVGDTVKVVHGSSPPCDGTIVQGSTKFDESSLTGESKMVSKSEGDGVFSGTINQGGAISVRLTGVAGNSMLDQIMKVVREGQTRRAPVERVADIITGHFVPIITFLAILTWIIWLALGLSGVLPESYRDTDIGGWPFWSLQFAIAVFVIACPCGIGLAAPTALFVGGGLAAKHGILVKGGGEAFQEASNLDCIVFDKTGTLTEGGQPIVTDHELFTEEDDTHLDQSALLSIVKRLEDDSSHPIAKAMSSFASTSANTQVQITATDEIAGRGMKASLVVNDQSFEVLIGNEALAVESDITMSSSTTETLGKWKSAAKSVVVLAVKPTASDKWSLAGIFAISDPLRADAKPVISALHRRGIATWLLSGDNAETAHAVAAQLSIPAENVIAGVLPTNKASHIQSLQASLHSSRKKGRALIAMVGDGVNDAPALAAADVGIAVGSGTDVALSAAKFVLITSRLTALLTLVDLSRAVFGRVRLNFGWALVYNLIGVPIAAGVLYPVVSGGQHIRLDPVWAALAMALSSVSVVCSSLLLRSGVPWLGFRPAKEIEA